MLSNPLNKEANSGENVGSILSGSFLTNYLFFLFFNNLHLKIFYRFEHDSFHRKEEFSLSFHKLRPPDSTNQQLYYVLIFGKFLGLSSQ